MKTYVLTSNEIRTLSFVNFGVAVLFSIGSACFGYWLNTKTNIILTSHLPPEALILQQMVQPIALVGGIVCYVLGGIVWYMRGGYLTTIEKETVSKP